MRLPTDDLLQQVAASGDVRPWAITALRWLLLLTGVCLGGCIVGALLFAIQAQTGNVGGMSLSMIALGLVLLIMPAILLLLIGRVVLVLGRSS
jgi:hypothetical protein